MSDFPYFLKVKINDKEIKTIKYKEFYYVFNDLCQAFPAHFDDDMKDELPLKHMTYLNEMGIQSHYYAMTLKQLCKYLSFPDLALLYIRSLKAYVASKSAGA